MNPNLKTIERINYPITVGLFAILLFVSIHSTSYSQTLNPFYKLIVDQTEVDSLKLKLEQFQDLGIKIPGSSALTNTSNWIENTYQNLGYSNIQRDNFSDGQHQSTNLIIDKLSTTQNDTIVIIGAHYDTKNGPGVNDNGTGTAILLEIARLIKDIPTKYAIRFVHFSSEESGLVGSNHYVNDVLIPSNDKVKLMFNIDEVGGNSSSSNTKVYCERDQSDPSSNNELSNYYTDTLTRLTELYSALIPEYGPAYGSDYLPFQEANYIITGLYEYDKSSVYHSINDSLKSLDLNYVKEICKVATAATLYYADAYDSLLSVLNLAKQKVSNHYFPFEKRLLIFSDDPIKSYSIFTASGINITKKIVDTSSRLYVNVDLSAGIYFLLTENQDGVKQTSKFVVY